ncbi:MAG: glycosyltransferase [bacterium]|nr:glycosyltransferase [bacterium]
MNVLCHGHSWNLFCPPDTFVERYAGPHDIRRLGIDDQARYRYDPLADTTTSILERIGAEWRPDLLVCWFPEEHPPPQGVEDAPIPTLGIPTDWNVNYARMAVNLARYDVVLCDRPGVDVLASDCVDPQYLFPLFSHVPDVHYPRPVEKDIDILYLGSWNYARNYQRARFLERIARLSDRYRIVYTKCDPGDRYAELMSRARVVFNHSVRGEFNLRVFESAACGAIPFIEASNAGVRDWLADGVDVVLYDESDVEDRLAQYLDHPEDAAALADRARTRIADFAGETRYDALIKWASAQPASGRRFRNLPQVDRDYRSALMYACTGRAEYHPLRGRLLAELTQSAPNDSRVWTALGALFLDPANAAGAPEERQQRGLNTFLRTHQLAPDSAPYAMNLATVCQAASRVDRTTQSLDLVLKASTLDGAELLVGAHLDRFWQRWQEAVVHGRATVALLHGEAHARLASFAAQRGALDAAVAHLDAVKSLDSDNHGGDPLRAEIAWTMGNKDEAIALLRAALPHFPFEFGVRKRVCDMLTETGQTDEAQDLANETLRILNACEEAV